MRRELSTLIIEIGFGVVFLVLPYWIPDMQDWMIYSSTGFGVILILVGIVMFFWKPKKQDTFPSTPRRRRQ